MHDVLRERLLRRIESLPEDRIYQVLDYIEFLESKYAPGATVEASGLQRFAERMEDRLRRRAVSPATLREAFQLISAADRVLQNVSTAGRQIFDELGGEGESDVREVRGGTARPPERQEPPEREGPPERQRRPELPGGGPDVTRGGADGGPDDAGPP